MITDIFVPQYFEDRLALNSTVISAKQFYSLASVSKDTKTVRFFYGFKRIFAAMPK